MVKISGFSLAFVFVGGGLGALSRWLLSDYIQSRLGFTGFPVGTLMVNVLGSFIIGFIMGASILYGAFTREQRLFLATGYAGSFTTFSTFEYENFRLLQSSSSLALINIMLSIILGLMFLYLGYAVAGLVYK
ncbi:MAG: fluoride efflux transporter CrcB [Desulfurococcales archaeon]|nr:fluoride efflux transporter CrcB [Desulfurococcales archaeon]